MARDWRAYLEQVGELCGPGAGPADFDAAARLLLDKDELDTCLYLRAQGMYPGADLVDIALDWFCWELPF